jgi:hypothetical protein
MPHEVANGKTPVPIIQDFLGTPMRFFETSFHIDLTPPIGGHYDPQSYPPYEMKTWAIPRSDFCRAIGIDETDIRRMINLSHEVFKPLYVKKSIPDALGRYRPTVLMAREMCMLILARLHTSRIKDQDIRQTIISFQRWVMIMFNEIGKGRFRPARFLKPDEARTAYLAGALGSGRAETYRAVSDLAAEEKRSPKTIYRRLQLVRGSNAITREEGRGDIGSDKGKKKHGLDYQLVMAYLFDHTRAKGREIKTALGLKTSACRINAWIREYFLSQHG